MRLEPVRIEVSGPDFSTAGSLTSWPATVAVGPVVVTLVKGEWPTLRWSVSNRSDAAVAIRSIALVLEMVDAPAPMRMLRNGYQSWSPTGMATLGVDRDPSTLADSQFVQAAYHADQRRARVDELRSEWVTLLTGPVRRSHGDHEPILVGFETGHDHDGTLRLRPSSAGKVELWCEAFLGGATIEPGEQRPLHGIIIDAGDDGAAVKLDRWAAQVGSHHGARVSAPHQVGWCSWYHYFERVTQDDVRANLARSGEWPFSVFQLDDGFQSAVGDWLQTNDDFPAGIDGAAADIARAGHTPGLWLAPFLAAPDSDVARRHPEWLAHYLVGGADAGPLRAWWNPIWGGGDRGFMYALDTTNPEVLDHLEHTAAALVEAGFGYLKLDFTFAPSVDGGWSDRSRTPAQRVRAGFEAIRRGAGDDVFILGCGVPLSNVVGVVDGNRIGQDVAPLWALSPDDEIVPGFLSTQPSTQSAFANTVARSFMHRRLWLNDPDCVMLRTTDTQLSPEAVRTWAHAVGVSGGMVLVSDDLAVLGADARSLLDDVIEISLAADAAAQAGVGAGSADLLDDGMPTDYRAAGYLLSVDPATGKSQLQRSAER